MKSKKVEIQVDFMGLCDHSMVSGDGKLSLIGIFDRIFVTQLPAGHPKCFVVAILKGPSGAECDVKVDFLSPDGKESWKGKPIAIHARLGQNGTGNIINEIVNLAFEMTGEYKVRLRVNGIGVKEIPLFVQKVMTNDRAGRASN